MAKVFTIVKQIQEYERLEKLTCDICKKEFSFKWNAGEYRSLETEIKFVDTLGTSDGGDGIEYSCDICPTCFKNKLMPLLTETYNIEWAEKSIEW